MSIVKGKIGNALESVAPDHVLGVAADIYDESRGQYQNTVNEAVGDYIDNSSWVHAVTDSYGHLLCGIKKNGEIEWSKGVPTPVKEYVDSQIAAIVGDDDLTTRIDSLREIIAFLEDYANSDNLKALLDQKVDIEAGKTLMDSELAESIKYIDNSSWVKLVTDAQGHILWGIKANGDVEHGRGVPTPTKDYIDSIDERITERIDEIIVNNIFSEYIDSSEWIYVVTDNDGRILFGIKADGSIEYGKGVPTPVKDYVDAQNPEYIVDINGSGDYTSLTKCIMDNLEKKNVVIHLMPGTYNLITELNDYYSTVEGYEAGYFEVYDRTSEHRLFTHYDYGIPLQNNITIMGTMQAVITCHYTGNNENVLHDFAPFWNGGNGGFHLKNIHMETSRVRYPVHDERGSNIDQYVAEYDGCYFKHDNTGVDWDVWKSRSIIGGGLGVNGVVKVTNCIFDSTIDSEHYPDGYWGVVSYHNPTWTDIDWVDARTSQAQNHVVCSGNYIVGNSGFSFEGLGPSHFMTYVILHNNNVGKATRLYNYIYPEHPDDIQNIELIEWNTVYHDGNSSTDVETAATDADINALFDS